MSLIHLNGLSREHDVRGLSFAGWIVALLALRCGASSVWLTFSSVGAGSTISRTHCVSATAPLRYARSELVGSPSPGDSANRWFSRASTA
jgi:hypothetical protein